MDFLSLFLYGGINVAMVVSHLAARGRYYEFPFWAGAISLGWFLPQAIGGYMHVEQFPDFAYARALFFAALCSLALWIGYVWGRDRVPRRASWLMYDFYNNRLYVVGALLCILGFYFQWKLSSLPDEMLAETQWSGASVKYYFLARIFRYGFMTLWILYLSQSVWLSPRLLVFLVPCWMMLFETAILHGRRAAMMDFVSYLVVSLWLVKRVAIPRWMIVTGISLGLLLVNAIGTYRSIMGDKKATMEQKISGLMEADLVGTAQTFAEKAYPEFKNYVFYSQTYADTFRYDYGMIHWNGVVFNYIPAQVVGRTIKDALMVPLFNPVETARRTYDHDFHIGTTSTGYCDAFGSFGWGGFIKFLWIGALMGILYRQAMGGAFLGQLLYVMMLGTAMHAVSHETNRILVSYWIYFFALCFPLLYWAKAGKMDAAIPEVEH